MSVSAQEPEEPGEEETPKETTPKFQGSSGVGGFGAVTPKGWGVIQTHLRNALDTEQDIRIVFRFTDTAQRQFIRLASLPPRSTRTVELPARPGDVDEDAKSVDTEIILFPLEQDLELDRASGSAIVRQSPSSFAVISAKNQSVADDEIDDEAVGALTAVRLQNGLDQSILYPTESGTPRFDIAWDAAYLTSITADRPNMDAAQRRALRRWIARGGVLVVWSDQVDSAAMANVIGEAWDLSEVDKVTLTEVKIDAPAGQAPLESVTKTEDPITLTRIVAPTWETHMSVAGWPAVVSKRLGRGQVVAITLGGRAWTGKGSEAALERLTSLLLPSTELQTSMTREPADVVAEEAGQGYVTQLIGYKVVSRGSVAAVLGLFLVTLAVCGIYWHRQGRGERLGVAAVGLAGLAAAALIMLGMKQRGELEPSAAGLQLVEVQPGLGSVHVSGVAGLFHAERTGVKITGDEGGWMWPIELTAAEDIQRLRTADLDDWAWTDLTIKAGAPLPLSFAIDVEAPRPMESDLVFGEKGLEGTVRWPIDAPFEDLMLVTPKGNMAIGVEGEGESATLTAGPEQVLAERTYFQQAVLSQVQQDRAAMLGKMLGQTRFDQPTLLGWSEGFGEAYAIEPELKRIDRAIWAAPLRINPTPAGDKVLVPWPLVRMEQQRYDDTPQRFGFASMPLHQPGGKFEDTDRDGKPDEFHYWLETSQPSGFVARFILPPQVLPLKVEGAKVHFDIRATGRPVRVLSVIDGKPVEITTLQGPDGYQTIDVPAEKLQVGPDGSVLIAFDVQNPGGGSSSDAGQPRTSSMTAMWRVHRFGLEVGGTVGR